jgi:hypothetical protein
MVGALVGDHVVEEQSTAFCDSDAVQAALDREELTQSQTTADSASSSRTAW